MAVETIRWQGGRPGRARILEQTLLPLETRYVELSSVAEMFDAIRRLAVRGAPAIGVAAAYGVLLGVQTASASSAQALVKLTEETAAILARSRPTAVNLFWALERMVARAKREHTLRATADSIIAGLFEEAHAIFEEDRAICRRIGEVGATLIGHAASRACRPARPSCPASGASSRASPRREWCATAQPPGPRTRRVGGR